MLNKKILYKSKIAEELDARKQDKIHDLEQMSSEDLKELIEENIKIIQEYFDFEVKVVLVPKEVSRKIQV